MDQIHFIGCYYTFPGCDRSTSVFRQKKFCKESCLHFVNECSASLKPTIDTYFSLYPGKRALFDCSKKPSRNAGDSPGCLYYHRKESLEKEDCLYLDGSSYYGNISMTASGISCQSWTEQCPHRHTMNKTYPELNNAENYCRNPQNSGQRPWCFTTDRHKRWEYCDIPKCIPVNGNYSRWYLSSQCNVTCGQGVKIWRRSCDNPAPKNGGRNCTVLGEDVKYRICERRPCPSMFLSPF
ncbi:Hypothetical predicted protein [Paramuricea clavata]|uniref:Uncharacterized protein n=1 Tax=Paramuricea clavata TaxID=317549 RepID=A0A6S7J7N5_PARCT|nr:Hypothetical predicted protein [Paramuricea clavata]